MFKVILSDIADFILWLKSWLWYRRHGFKMSLAIRLADIKQQAFNKRYFIMLIALPDGDKLVSINNEEFERMKRIKWLPAKMSTLDLERESFYQTPLCRNNTATREERMKARNKYLKYVKRLS